MAMQRSGRRFLSLVLVLAMATVTMATRANAAQDVTYTKGDIVDGTMEFRYVTISETKWTGLKTVGGQPKKGTYLKAGDQLLWVNTKGNSNATLSIAIGATYGYASGSVSFTIPLGKVTSSGTTGVAKTATKNGYYLLKVNKQIKCTAKFSQYRTVSYTYDSKTKKHYYKPTSGWGHTTLIKKTQKELRANPQLVKQ